MLRNRAALLAAAWLTLCGGALLACGGGEQSAAICPAPGTTPASEACIRSELGIPPQADRVLILSQSSHLDWDWLSTFTDYYEHQVDGIFSNALTRMTEFHSEPTRYYYSIAEIGYLQRFVATHPELLQSLRTIGNDLRIVGGGITSPDNLLPHGESIIRDYLVGKTWVDATLGLPLRAAWIPDDFGHDAQLPVALAAMGFDAVGFARVPGVDTSRSFSSGVPSPGSLAEELLASSLDFVWEAADGSRVIAHWMPQSYCQGDAIDQPAAGQPSAGETADAIANMQRYLAVNGPASPTPYVFVPIGCDFAVPKPHLLDYVRAWNETEYPRSGVWAVAGTFDHYAQLIAAYRDTLPVRRFDPSPYWTGFYASRPLLKTLHYAATRALLAAEVFGALADGIDRADAPAWRERVAARRDALHGTWETLVPSNHHDFVTGTSLDPVYQDEQVPRLSTALAQAEAQRDQALDDLAAAIAATPGDGEQAVAVFNALGFERAGLVELSAPGVDAAAVRAGAADGGTAQRSADGTLLFAAAAPSFGYDTVYLQGGAAPVAADGSAVSVAVSPDGGSIVLENAALRAEISRASAWGISSLIDKASGTEMIMSGAAGNTFTIYDDQGGLYRFGNEMSGCGLEAHDGDARASLPAEILETGPLRARVRAPLQLAGQPFETVYTLVAGEPFLRMRATGAAPLNTSVMVSFPLAGPIDALVHGTPSHWDRKTLARAPWGVSFEATHDFLVPELAGVPRGAVYHTGSPAWAAEPDGLLLGVLWRSTRREQCEFYGGLAIDPDPPHAVDYALRVPTGIEPPETGRQLREALSFATPLLARIAAGAGPLPPRHSLASATAPVAMLTAAKSATASPQALVVRLYQPTNAPLPVEITTAARSRVPPHVRLTVRPTTALEEPLDGTAAAELRVRGGADRFRLVARRALTTVSIAPED